MNVKRLALAFVAVFIVSQILNFLIHGLWLDPVYEANAAAFRGEEEMVSLSWVFFITGAIMTAMFCYIFTLGYENRGIGEGVRYGIYMGLFMTVVQSFDSYVIYPLPYHLALKWFLSGMASFIILGIVLALIYKPADDHMPAS